MCLLPSVKSCLNLCRLFILMLYVSFQRMHDHHLDEYSELTSTKLKQSATTFERPSKQPKLDLTGSMNVSQAKVDGLVLTYLCNGLLLFSTVELNYLCEGLLLFSTVELNYLCDGLLLFSTVELNCLDYLSLQPKQFKRHVG